ncbi:MAG: hypothetical protein KAG84_07000 [Bacteroidales bacterium]|nr:hypothetical protein [Bacteroidales bacterium]
MLDETTNNKLIKTYLREGFKNMKSRVEEWEKQKQPDNQLDLFDWFKEPELEQSSMLADDEFLDYSKSKK